MILVFQNPQLFHHISHMSSSKMVAIVAADVLSVESMPQDSTADEACLACSTILTLTNPLGPTRNCVTI